MLSHRPFAAAPAPRHRVALLGLCASLAFACLAPAQDSPGELPAALRTGSVTAAQQPELDNFIAQHVQGLSGSPEAIRTARATLLRQLSPDASVSFRLRYADSLGKSLRPILENPQATELARVNVLVIAGEIATAASAELIGVARTSPQPSVRYQAADATRAIFEKQLEAGAAATIDTTVLQNLVQGQVRALRDEKDPLVIDAGLGALFAAVQVDALRTPAVEGLAAVVVGLVRTSADRPADTIVQQALTRTATNLRNDLAQRGRGYTPEALRAAATLGGSVVWHVQRVVRAKAIPTDQATATQRDALARLTNAGEGLALFSGTLMAPTFSRATSTMAEKLRAATAQGDAGLIADADEFLRALLADPFRLPADSFR